jgi:hypothetical protein
MQLKGIEFLLKNSSNSRKHAIFTVYINIRSFLTCEPHK